MTISSLRYLIADLFHGQLGTFTDKCSTEKIIRVTPENNEESAQILNLLASIDGLKYFQGHGLDEESSQTILLFGGTKEFFIQALHTLVLNGISVIKFSVQSND